jgi:glycosyltransferase involved in cell wall biosynthesis
MASVSVVIPCYNYGRFLRNAAASVLSGQDGVDVRVLIIDDASADDSAEIARSIARQDSRVEVRAHTANKGHIATYNEGLLDWADGDYSLLLSADDQVTPGALRRAADFLDAHPGAGFVFGRTLCVRDGASLPQPRTVPRHCAVWPGRSWLERRFHHPRIYIRSPEVVVRTSLQKRVGGYDPRLPHAGDMEMWMRLAANADVGYLRGVHQAYYRLHERNMHASYNLLDSLSQRRLAYESVLGRYGELLPRPSYSSGVIHRKLSKEALWAAVRAHEGDSPSQTAVSDLIAFAFDCWPGASKFPVYHILRLRRNIGMHGMSHVHSSALGPMLRMPALWRQLSWRLYGG